MSKVSSSLCGRLRRLFLQNPSPGDALVTVTRDKNISNIVNQFKNKSSSTHFRRQRLVYKITVRRLAEAGHFSSINEILDHQKRYPDIKDEHFTARLICLYGQAKMLDHAFQLFDEMPDLNCPRTVISFNALLAACFPAQSFGRIVELFREVPGKLSIKPNVISYTSVIKPLCEMGSSDEAVLMLKDMEKNGVKPNAVTFDALLGAFYRSGRFCDAENLWKSMEEKGIIPNLRCYNFRLLGMVNGKGLAEAIELFKGLEDKGLKPNTYTYNVMINGFVNECNLEEVKTCYKTMLDMDCDLNYITFATLVTFACDNNDMDFAFEVCKKSVGSKNKVSRKIMKKVIDKLVEQLKTDKAKELMELDNSKSQIIID